MHCLHLLLGEYFSACCHGSKADGSEEVLLCQDVADGTNGERCWTAGVFEVAITFFDCFDDGYIVEDDVFSKVLDLCVESSEVSR